MLVNRITIKHTRIRRSIQSVTRIVLTFHIFHINWVKGLTNVAIYFKAKLRTFHLIRRSLVGKKSATFIATTSRRCHYLYKIDPLHSVALSLRSQILRFPILV